jgi:hypothetical protein
MGAYAAPQPKKSAFRDAAWHLQGMSRRRDVASQKRSNSTPIAEAAMNKPTTTASTTETSGSKESLAHIQNGLIEPWAEATSRCTRAAFDWGAEAIRFAGHRLERTRETFDHLPTCGSWEELANLHMNWTKDLIQDYMNQGSQFMEIAQKMSGSFNGSAKPERGNGSRRASR